jgi:hypothetical protein
MPGHSVDLIAVIIADASNWRFKRRGWREINRIVQALATRGW